MSRRYGWCLLPALLILTGAEPKVGVDADGKPLPDGALVRLGPTPGLVARDAPGVAFTPDGTGLVTSMAERAVCLVSLTSGEERHRFVGLTSSRFALSADGKVLAGANPGGTVALWDTATGTPLAPAVGGLGWCNSLAVSADGSLIATGDDDHFVQLWDIRGGRVRRIEGHTGYVSAVALSPDGKTVASGSLDRTLRLWNTATGEEVRRLAGHEDTVAALTFSSDGKRLLSGGWDGTVRLWDVATGNALLCFEGHAFQVQAVALSRDGRVAASGATDCDRRRLPTLPELPG